MVDRKTATATEWAAYLEGLLTGLRLAKKHAEATPYNPETSFEDIDWSKVDEAIAKEIRGDG